MTVAEELATLKDKIAELESEYCENCQEWDCDYCSYGERRSEDERSD